MNLLVVGTDFPPSSGGISRYTKELASALSKTCQVTVLAPGARNSSTSDQAFSFRIVRTPPVPLLCDTAISVYIPWLLRRDRIDAVLHAVWPTSLISHLWYYLLPVPYFVTVHASEILDDRVTWRRRFKRYLRRWRQAALQKAKGIFPVSHYSAGLTMDLGIEKNRIHVITNGVDPECFKPVSKGKSNNGQKTLLTVARLDLHKGHDRVLEALALLKEEGLRPHYNIVGEGEEEKRLRSLTQRLGLESQVTFTGFIPDNQLPNIYAESDIFIMASREIPGRLDLIEGFGISLLEASASGLPVIAGRSGGVEDAVLDGETGILVNPDDPHDIAQALKLLLDNNALANDLGEKGRHWTETQMSWDHAADRVLNAVQRLI